MTAKREFFFPLDKSFTQIPEKLHAMMTKTISNEEMKHLQLRSHNVLMVSPFSLTEVQKDVLK